MKRPVSAPRPVVMVVDDDPLLRTCLAELLAEFGFDTLTEGDGAAALDLLDNMSPSSDDMPSVMLVDVMMPHMNDYQLAAALRSRSVAATVPVIFYVLVGAGVDALPGPRLPVQTVQRRTPDCGDSRCGAGRALALQLKPR